MKRVENKIYLIYKFTNKINNKSYIGFTCRGFELRRYEHIYLSTKASKFKFHLALKKYGIENFHEEILENNISSLPEVNNREIFYIKHYDSYRNGYNMTIGGGYCCDYVLTDESREKMRNAKLGIKLSDETRLKQSLSLKGIPKSEEHKLNAKNALIGRKLSKETRGKMSKSMLGKSVGEKNPAAIRINIYDNNNKLIFMCNGTFELTCNEHNLPTCALRNSYYNNGKPIYNYKYMKKEILSKYEKYVGWSAVKL